MQYFDFLRALLSLFTRKERLTLCLLVLMMTGGAAFETLSIGLIVPLISVIGNPELIEENKALNYAYNWLGASSTDDFLLHLAVILLLVYVLKNFYLGLLAFAQSSFIFKKQAGLSRNLLAYYLNRPYAFHLQHNTAELQYNILGAVNNVTGGIVSPLLSALAEVFVLAFILALLFAVEPRVTALTVVIFVGFAWALQKAFKGFLTRHGQASNIASKSMVKTVNEALGSIKDIKILGRESFFLSAFDTNSLRYIRSARVFATLNAMPRLLAEMLVIGGLLLTVAVLLTQQGALQQAFPVLALVGAAALRMMPSVTRIIGAINSVRFNYAAVTALSHKSLEAYGPQLHIDSTRDRQQLGAFQSLELRSVDYQYAGDRTPSLSRVSLTVRRGDRIGIVGSTGGGKSTLINVMLGLLDPTGGDVLIGTTDLRNVREQWQEMIGYVPQSIYLLDDTVRRNVALGVADCEIDNDAVWGVLEAARIADKVRSLPKGLDTCVGENGIRLSGGERQRLGIARALLPKPQVLIFDEATSSLDTQTEREITDTIHALGDERTVIVVTHRLTTVMRCDRVHLVNAGRIVDIGTYDDLLARNKEFREMVGVGESHLSPADDTATPG